MARGWVIGGIVTALIVGAFWGRERFLSPTEYEEQAVSLPIRWGQVKAWLNTSEPPTHRQLEGRVILVFFWSYSNAASLEALETVLHWQSHYGDSGLEVIGVHTPDFSFERSVEWVANEVRRLGIPFPVAIDNDRGIWTAFSSLEWPAYYVIDARGDVSGFQIGVGREMEVEQYIRQLLQSAGFSVPPTLAVIRSVSSVSDTPEALFRGIPFARLSGVSEAVIGQPRVYALPEPFPLHAAALEGVWQFEEEGVRSVSPHARFVVRYSASRCHMVVGGPVGAVVQVRLDGKGVAPESAGKDLWISSDDAVISLGPPRLYTLIDTQGVAQEHTLELICPKEVSIYACTFS